MEITVSEEEVNKILEIVSNIPTKYGIPIVTAIQDLWNEKTKKEIKEEEKIDQN